MTIYRTLQGKRLSFKNVNTQVKSRERQALWVDFAVNRLTVAVDTEQAIEATDDPFGDAGKVDGWTKTDSVTSLDEFS